MALIKLTIAGDDVNDSRDGQKVFVNTLQINSFYRWPEIDATVVTLSNPDAVLHVDDTPEKIAAKIESAEHPECRL